MHVTISYFVVGINSFQAGHKSTIYVVTVHSVLIWTHETHFRLHNMLMMRHDLQHHRYIYVCTCISFCCCVAKVVFIVHVCSINHNYIVIYFLLFNFICRIQQTNDWFSLIFCLLSCNPQM